MSLDAAPVNLGKDPGGAQPARRTGTALAIIVVVQLMLTIDLMIVTVALPSIGKDLGYSENGLAWVVNAYGLALGGLMLLGGRLGDTFGRRRLFLVGIALFTVASLVGGFAPYDWWFLVCRALQGVGAALVMPNCLALILSLFPAGPERTKAIATSAAASSSGAVVGLLLGGVLSTGLSWRWVMFVNVPVGLAVLVLAPLFIGEQARVRGKFDIAGAMTSALGVALLVFGLSHAGEAGWSTVSVWLPILLGAALFIAFILVERRAAQPIMPLSLFRDRNRVTAYISAVLVTGTMIGQSFFLTMFLQGPLGFNPLLTGFAFLTTGFALVISSTLFIGLIRKVGERWVSFIGALMLVAGNLWLTTLSLDSGYWGTIFGPLALTGIGMAATLIPATEMAGAGVASDSYGSASSTYNTMLQLGGPFVLAILVTVLTTASKGITVPADVPGDQAEYYVLTESMGPGFLTATILAVGVAVTSLFIRRTTPAPPA
ncbi:EmrB/QacA subfamily drug resistance transporter [Nocardia tenerifensis]|uniref:EmrB/QacA subfamily drug resistance transporter n=1 Tax=Nocardia tenerifensis TaxID=228006 RepID=A0A318JV23_9NOCA|nr:MFS transporter [Nocardia tenerifensis]PXX59784.1 EmrB/QacA subfamily drug resistance transporter [Nocardia tenerifensis]